MNTHEYTDPDGDALTTTTDPQGVWITATSGPSEVTVGPFPKTVLDVDARAGEPTRTREHLLAEEHRLLGLEKSLRAHLSRTINRAETAEHARDAAKAEAAMCQTSLAGQIRRAETAEQEREQWKKVAHEQIRRAEKAEKEREQAEDALAAYVTAQASRDPRPLTPEAITDEMVDRAWETWGELLPRDKHSMRFALRAALTPPPSRPEGAEEIEGPLRQVLRLNGQTPDETTVSALSDALAERGVRVTGAES